VSIRCVYEQEPAFPASDQHPDAQRYNVGGWWVDAIGGEPTEAEVAAVLAPPVPQSVTKRQAVQALILAGLDDDVEAQLAGIPGVQGKLARAEWRESNTVERNRPLVAQLGAALGLSSAQLDALFIQAAGL
jgi:hypothetical protein